MSKFITTINNQKIDRILEQFGIVRETDYRDKEVDIVIRCKCCNHIWTTSPQKIFNIDVICFGCIGKADIFVTKNGVLQRAWVRPGYELEAYYNYNYLGYADLFKFDLKCTDRYYWNSARQFLLWLSLERGSQWFRDNWDALKAARNKAREKTWEEALSNEIVEWAWNQLNTTITKRHLNCVDNYRVAKKGNTPQMRRYNKQKENGWCGRVDFEAVGPDGNKYFLGCDYGH